MEACQGYLFLKDYSVSTNYFQLIPYYIFSNLKLMIMAMFQTGVIPPDNKRCS